MWMKEKGPEDPRDCPLMGMRKGGGREGKGRAGRWRAEAEVAGAEGAMTRQTPLPAAGCAP